MNIKRIVIACVLVVDAVFLIVAVATNGLIIFECKSAADRFIYVYWGFGWGDSDYDDLDNINVRVPTWRAFIIISILVTAFGAALSFTLAVIDDLEKKIAVPLAAVIVIGIGVLSTIVCFSVIAADYNYLKKNIVADCTMKLAYGFALIVVAFVMSVACAIASVLLVLMGRKFGAMGNSGGGQAQGGMQQGSPAQGLPYPAQQEAAYPGHQGTAYPGQQGAAYPGQQGTAYTGQQGAAYPGQQGMAYPSEQGMVYQGQQGMVYPAQQGLPYPPPGSAPA